MNIPDEIYHRAYEAGEFQMADYKVIAEWARKEALREAEAAIAGITQGYMVRGVTAIRLTDAATALHNLGGVPDGQQ